MPISRLSRLRDLLHRLRDPGGFGLIELTIALTILAIATVALTGVFVASHLTLRRASQSDAAAVLSDKLLERFRAQTWDNVALNSSQVSTADSTYSGDVALSDPDFAGLTPWTPMSPARLGYDITEADAPLAADGTAAATGCTNSPEPVTCYPTQTEVGPDGKSYRLDTFVTWGCPDKTNQALGGTMNAPTCTDTSSSSVLPVKVVTIVVRDASSSTLPVVYRSSTAFDRLGGDSLPTPTAVPTGVAGTTTGSTTPPVTTTPNPPDSVTFINGVGSGTPCPCITNNNETSPPGLSFDVQFPSTSLATDTFTFTLTDGGGHTFTESGTAPQGAGIVHLTGLNVDAAVGTSLVDGPVTVSAYASNTQYGKSGSTISSVTKDTTPPAGVSIVSPANGQSGVSVSGPFTGTGGYDFSNGDRSTVTVQFCKAATWTCSTPTQTGTANVDSSGNWSLPLTGSSKLQNGKSYTMRVVQYDAAGNTATSNDVSFST